MEYEKVAPHAPAVVGQPQEPNEMGGPLERIGFARPQEQKIQRLAGQSLRSEKQGHGLVRRSVISALRAFFVLALDVLRREPGLAI